MSLNLLSEGKVVILVLVLIIPLPLVFPIPVTDTNQCWEEPAFAVSRDRYCAFYLGVVNKIKQRETTQRKVLSTSWMAK